MRISAGLPRDLILPYNNTDSEYDCLKNILTAIVSIDLCAASSKIIIHGFRALPESGPYLVGASCVFGDCPIP